MIEKKNLESKQDFSNLLFRMLNPLLPYYSEERAGVVVGTTGACYGSKIVRTEAFLRPLWGLVPFWAGGGSNEEFEKNYLWGLTAGTNPQNKEYWEGFYNGDQRFVEMASIAYGLLFAPEKLWNPLSETEKDNLVNWLSGINQYQLPVCNWIFFAILVNVALKKLGRPYNKEQLEYYLNSAESFYLGDGWYQDGSSQQKDYYISFAIHFYSLVYAKAMEEEDPVRSSLFKERANIFAQQFIYWFDENGAALAYGRSLTYRFAQVAFFSACLMADVHPFSIGQIKGLIVRHLHYWMEQPIFDKAELLTIGYGYPNLGMAEIYNAPGSPYWAMKTFALLMLPDEHPFWQAKTEPLPKLEIQKALPHAQMLIHRYPNHVTAYVPGKFSGNDLGHYTPKYGKFAYDSRFAFSIPKSTYLLRDTAPDSMLAFEIHNTIFVRRGCEQLSVTEKDVKSKWSPYPGITVETTITPTAQGHIRSHRVTSEIECVAYDCGFAIQTDVPGSEDVETDTAALAKNEYSGCQVTSQKGNGKPFFIGAAPNTHLLYTMTRIPAVLYQIVKGENRLQTNVIAEYTVR